MPFRLSSPLAANPRMENPLKRASPGRVAKHYCSKFLSIQVAVAGKDGAAKLDANFLFYLRKFYESVRCFIRIEEIRCGNDLAQAFAERAFTCGNSAGDPNRGH